MARYRYRAATSAGELRAGTLDADSHTDVLVRLRRLGLLPIEAVETKARAEAKTHGSVNSATRQAVANALGELAVLLNAGLALDRALSVTIDNCTRPILKAAKLGHLRLHDLRHSMGSLAIAQGVSVKVVSDRLGHSTTRMTQDRYLHVLPGLQREAADAIDAALSTKKLAS